MYMFKWISVTGIKENEMGKAYGMDENKDNAYRDFDKNPEGRIVLGRYKCRWQDNIKMDLNGVGKVMDSIHLSQNMDQRWILWTC